MPTTEKYLIPSTGKYATPYQLSRMNEEAQIDAMRHWFNENYDSPDELPYDSGEGGFQWIWGGPYDAREALRETFDRSIKDDVINELAADLNNISTEWSGKPDSADLDDDYLDELRASGADPFLTLCLSLDDIADAAQIKAADKELRILHKLLFANIVTAFETFLGDLFMKELVTSDRYIEDFVLKTPYFRNTTLKLSDIFERFRRIDTEVRSHIHAHNWHMLRESGLMYKRAFNVRFPETPAIIANGIRDRHNIVHRNGKSIEGTDGTWGVGAILALTTSVVEFAANIDSQVRTLSGSPSADSIENPDASHDPVEI